MNKQSNICLQKVANHMNTLPCGKKVGINYSGKQIGLHEKLCKTCKENPIEHVVSTSNTQGSNKVDKDITDFYRSISTRVQLS